MYDRTCLNNTDKNGMKLINESKHNNSRKTMEGRLVTIINRLMRDKIVSSECNKTENNYA